MVLEARKKLEEEIKVLQKELTTELPRALTKALAMGDLRENGDYQAAKERQEFVRARLGQLKQRLSDLAMVNMEKIPHDRISLGSTVVLFDVEKEVEVTYRLVTSEDSDVTGGAISTSSPIGRSLLGKQEGDTVRVRIPAGARTFEVVSFTTIHDSGRPGAGL
jgi:transcription elongation factor GreA